MTGTITKRLRRDGKPAWGYAFFGGRTSDGKRIQITKSGFESRKEAGDALLIAIQEHRRQLAVGPRLVLEGIVPTVLELQAAVARQTAKQRSRRQSCA